MQFVHPKFLWALLFLAVPLIIHLFYFRRYQRILFSNTQFLQEIKEEQSTRNKLKHLLVLIARMLALLFLVFAFAQPFIPDNKSAQAQEKLVSVYLDNSFSMQAEGKSFLLYDEAKNLAKDIINAYGENNQFLVLSNDFEAKHARIVSKAEALGMLEEMQVSAASQEKALIFEKQKNLANKFDGLKIIYQISDFQTEDLLPIADSNQALQLVSLSPSNIRNISIEEVWFDAPIQLVGQNNRLLVKLSNRSEEEQTGSFQLMLNGEAKSIGNFTIPPNDEVIDTLQFTITQESWNEGKVTINDYPLTFDDTYFFSFFVEKNLNVYCVYEGLGEKYPKAVFSGNEQVVYTSANVGQVNYNTINDQHLVVVSQLKSLSTGLIESLKKYLENGGQVFFIPSKDGNVSTYNQFLSTVEAGSFGAKLSEKRTIANINLEHNVLNDIFDEVPQNLKLPEVYQYFSFNKNVQQESILSFADGSSYLSSVAVGEGNIYILASDLDDQTTNFQQQAIFAPITYKMAVLGAKNSNIAYTIEANTSVLLQKAPQNSDNLFRLQSEATTLIPQKSNFNGSTLLNLPGLQLAAGFYNVSLDESDYKAVIALNYNRKEGNLSYFSVEDMLAQFENTNVNVLENNISSIQENVKLLEEGHSFWKLCIILALIFLAIEILLLRFYPN